MDLLRALRGDRHRADDRVALLLLERGDDHGEARRLDLRRRAELLRDGVRDVDVVAGGLSVDDRLCGWVRRVDAPDDRVRDGRRPWTWCCSSRRRHRRRRRRGSKTGAASASSGRRRFTDCPPVVRDRGGGRLYRPSSRGVSAWKWAISCSLWLIRTPRSTRRLRRRAARPRRARGPPCRPGRRRRGARRSTPARRRRRRSSRGSGTSGRARAGRSARSRCSGGREDVDPEVRPEEMELRARQLVVRGSPSRSGPCWVERRPSVERTYASGETSTSSLNAGCATWQW